MRALTRLRPAATQAVAIRKGDRALVRNACGTTLGACKKIGDHRVAQIFLSSRVLPHQNRMPLALSPRPDHRLDHALDSSTKAATQALPTITP